MVGVTFTVVSDIPHLLIPSLRVRPGAGYDPRGIGGLLPASRAPPDIPRGHTPPPSSCRATRHDVRAPGMFHVKRFPSEDVVLCPLVLMLAGCLAVRGRSLVTDSSSSVLLISREDSDQRCVDCRAPSVRGMVQVGRALSTPPRSAIAAVRRRIHQRPRDASSVLHVERCLSPAHGHLSWQRRAEGCIGGEYREGPAKREGTRPFVTDTPWSPAVRRKGEAAPNYCERRSVSSPILGIPVVSRETLLQAHAEASLLAGRAEGCAGGEYREGPANREGTRPFVTGTPWSPGPERTSRPVLGRTHIQRASQRHTVREIACFT